MSKKKRRKKRYTTSIGEAWELCRPGLLRSAAVMGQQLMEHVLKTDPKIRSLVEQLVKARLERALRNLRDKEK